MLKVFISNILKYGEKQNYSELKKLVLNTSQQIIFDAIKYTIKTDGGVNFWNYLLKGFALCANVENYNKRRFECVEMFLRELSIIELSYKKTYDLITRLCSELMCFDNNQLQTIIEICYDAMRFGDTNLVWWKDLFPETLVLLSNQAKLDANGLTISGLEYKNDMIKSVFSMKWNLSNLTPLANMFVELKLNNDDIVPILVKFCKYILKINPAELPPLAYQLFCLCQTASQLIIPVLGLEKYFHHFYYKRLFTDLDSESSCFDSIDLFTEKDLREAEETILHHLSFCTRFRISEEQVCIVLRNLVFSPDTILTPFILSAVISMSQANRDPDCWILSSPLLIFLRNIIKINEEQKQLSKDSVWCEDTFHIRSKNIEQILTILIDQNKEGKDVITPGLVNFAFVLLKAKNCKRLNLLSTIFLAQFVKKRFVFGYGIVQKLADWMITEPDSEQYAECLAVLSHSDTFTVSESFKTIKNVLDFFLWIPGKNAMRMISFVLPVIKISQPIRDAFIDIMKKAINSKNVETCHLGVYGFCCLLKQINNNNSQRSTISGTPFMLTQQCISGYSLMSQSTGNRPNSQRHFEILVLEIIGCLRKCFVCPVEIKETLYENLNRITLLNSKLAPFFLEFLDNHFRTYFKVDESETEIYFEKIVYKEPDGDTIKVCDNIGQLTILVSSIILVCEKNEIVHNSAVVKTIIKTVIDRIISKDYKLMDELNSSDSLMFLLGIQKLNFLEALMYYLLWTSRSTNNNVVKLHKIFEEYQKVKKLVEESTKKSKKVKDTNEKNDKTIHATSSTKKLKNPVKFNNIWDLLTLERFLKLLFDDLVPFANSDSVKYLKNDNQFVKHVLEVTAEYLEDLQLQPKYKQIKLSTRLFKQMCLVTKIIYDRGIKNLFKLLQTFDMKTVYLLVQCLKQSLVTMQKVYDKKYEQYIREVDVSFSANSKETIFKVIQNTFEQFIKQKEEFEEDNYGPKVPGLLLECLQVLYHFTSSGTPLAIESFDWLYSICQKYEIGEETSIIYNLLFTMRLKTRSGVFFETIALHLGKTMGEISEAELFEPKFNFKALTLASSTSCYNYLISSLRKQLEYVDFFISKAKSSFYNLKFIFDDDQERCNVNLKTMERSICTQFIHISNCLTQMVNIDAPLGECMDNLMRMLIQYYISLNNLTKHLMLRHSSLPVSLLSIKYDQVVRLAGKPLASRIYVLIINIDEKIVNYMDKKKKHNPTADRAKVLKETKFLPKLILRIENFNKSVMFLSKKTENDLSNFLHIGTVRDFRIQTKSLKEAIDESLAHSSQVQDELTDQISENNDEIHSEDNNNDRESYTDNTSENQDVADAQTVHSEEVSKKNKKNKNKKLQVESVPKNSKKLNESINENDCTPSMGVLNEQESDENAGLQFLQNVVMIAEKGRKRTNKVAKPKPNSKRKKK